MLAEGPVRHLLPKLPNLMRIPHRMEGLVALGVCVVAVGVWRVMRRSPPDLDAVELGRRERLTRIGRLTDGSLVDTTTLDGRFLAETTWPETPRMLLYRYNVAGVGYEAMQDVSAIEDLVRGLRVDLPIQVRYDLENPADSIVVAEGWCGLRFARAERGRVEA